MVYIGLYNSWTQVKHVSIHRSSVWGDKMNICRSLFEGTVVCTATLFSLLPFVPFPHRDSLSYIVFLKSSWPYTCWSSGSLLECLSHRTPPFSLLWVVVVKTALFTDPLHINAAKKVAATHLMRQQQPFLEYLTFPSFLRVCGMHPYCNVCQGESFW